MDQVRKSQLQDELTRCLGPRHFLPDGGGRLGTALPSTTADVQRVLRLTRDDRVPIVLRAATTSSFAATSAADGLVIALAYMGQIRGVHERNRLTTVQPGVIWRTLDEYLAPHGLMPKVYPGSEGFSTVGGFVAQGGFGIGSYEFGAVGATVAAVDVLDAGGELHYIKGHDLGLVVGAEGRTGIIVRVLLRLQTRTAMVPVIAVMDSFEQGERCLMNIADRALPLWSVHLLGPIGAGIQSHDWPGLALPLGKHAIIVSYRDTDGARVAPGLHAGVASAGGRLIQVTGDPEDWLVQFASLQAQDTTPVGMQFRLPLGQAATFMGSIRRDLHEHLAKEAVVVDRGASIVVRLFFAERGVSEEQNRIIGRELLVLAKRAGGSIYATGSAYLQEAKAVFGAEHLRALRRFRRRMDPDNRLNPGMAFL